jgi:hypothetical protein
VIRSDDPWPPAGDYSAPADGRVSDDPFAAAPAQRPVSVSIRAARPAREGRLLERARSPSTPSTWSGTLKERDSAVLPW